MKIFIFSSILIFFIPTMALAKQYLDNTLLLFNPIIVFGKQYLDYTPLGPVMNVSGDSSEIDMDAVNKVLQNLKPEEVPMYLKMKTLSGKTLLQVILANKPSEKDLYQQILQIAIKLEQQGWSVHKIAKAFYRDTIFISDLSQHYPRIYQILKHVKRYGSSEQTEALIKYIRTSIAAIPTKAVAKGARKGLIGGMTTGILFPFISIELGFMDLAEIMEAAYSDYVMATTKVGALVGYIFKAKETIKEEKKILREKKRTCESIFSEYSLPQTKF